MKEVRWHIAGMCGDHEGESPDDRAGMEARLASIEGIERVTVRPDGDGCDIAISFDPQRITEAALREEVDALPQCTRPTLEPGVACVTVPVKGVGSASDARDIERLLNRLPGVKAGASYVMGTLRIEFDAGHCPVAEIDNLLKARGYQAMFEQASRCAGGTTTLTSSIAGGGRRRWYSPVAVTRWLVAHPDVGLIALSGMMLIAGAVVHWSGGPLWLRLALLACSAICSSTETGPDAVRALRRLRLDVDVLMFAAAIGASYLGHYEEGVFLLFLFGLGHAGEHLALDRARDAIRSLSRIAPDTAWRLGADGREQSVPVASVAVDDRVLVKPYERVPVDGEVQAGSSAVDQAPITGESTPVEKAAGDGVFAGTINGGGRLEVRVTKSAGESTLARIITLVEEAQTSKSPTQMFTEKIERWYVPFVFAATAFIIVLPPALGWQPRFGDGSVWGGWFYQAMAFLTAASPCALAIGTPAAVLCGIARSARVGVLIKGGGHLEDLGRVGAIAFDKTGTLTVGKPVVADVLAMGAHEPSQVLALAAAVESQVTHPLAEAIALEAAHQGAGSMAAADVEQAAGQGASGWVDGRRVTVGKPNQQWLSDPAYAAFADRVHELSRLGKTTVAVSVEDEPVGLIALADQPRVQAGSVLNELRALGVRHLVMLTGDHREAGHAIARELGIEHCHAELLPEEKLHLVDELEREHGSIAMVGDGVNDAPALAKATVGIAMGAAGADVAMETADVVLMGSDLRKLPEAVGLSRFSRRIIAQNLLIALGVIAVVAPLAAIGVAALGWAVLLHEGSTVIVVINALRLLRYRRAKSEAGAGEDDVCGTCSIRGEGGCRFGLVTEAQVQGATP